MHRVEFSEKIILELVAWLNDNLHEDLSIDNVAKRAGYSRWHLQRIFKKYMGKSLGEYIRRERLYHAAVKLKNNQRAILAVAVNYNFNSHQTFSRAFRHNLHCSPSLCSGRNDSRLQGLYGAELCKACRQLYEEES